MLEATAQVSAATPREQILGVVNNYWQGCCVGAAAQLEIADHLAGAPLHVDVLAERTKTHAPSLYRLLRALESIGLFTQTSPRVFANTPQSECLRRYAEGSQWAWIRICLCPDSFVVDGWRGLILALQNGRTGIEQVRGCSAWECMQADPQQGTFFNAAMRDLSASMTPAVTASYNWSQFPVIADIGGGIGAQLSNILDAHPSCRGILFDQPQVVEEAAQHDRMERLGGDFFANIPVQADAYLMRWIIHDWADDRSSCHSSERERGSPVRCAIGARRVGHPGDRRFDTEKWMDINMLVNAGGRERTATEFRELYDQAGFELEKIVATPSPLSIIIGKPRALGLP